MKSAKNRQILIPRRTNKRYNPKMKMSALPLFVILLPLTVACTSSTDAGSSGTNTSEGGEIAQLNCTSLSDEHPAPEASNWAYWLSDINIGELEAADFDLAVIDYSTDGSEEEEFSAQDIQSLKDSGKTVLAYMSIGEAEVDRFYWDSDWIDGDGNLTDDAPDWLAQSNPDFPDNYKVRYWQEDWQNIIFGTDSGADKSYLDRIIDAGFDGVYLDIIDAFEYFGPDGDEPERDTAGEDMIDFVLAIAEYARTSRGEAAFMVFPQNGSLILEESSACAYLEAINGLGAEDTFYYGDEENNNDLDEEHAAEVAPYLNAVVEAGKAVLAIDYVQDADKVTDFYERADDLGYLPYTSVRDLNELTINE